MARVGERAQEFLERRHGVAERYLAPFGLGYCIVVECSLAHVAVEILAQRAVKRYHRSRVIGLAHHGLTDEEVGTLAHGVVNVDYRSQVLDSLLVVPLAVFRHTEHVEGSGKRFGCVGGVFAEQRERFAQVVELVI